MGKWRVLAAVLLAAMVALGPSFADARAGGSYGGSGGGSFSSMGSRGSRTYDTPMQRSTTPYSSPYGAQPNQSYGGYHPFWSGLAGGLFGGFIGSLLFPHWGMGYGGWGFGGFIGSLFSWIFLLGLLWMAVRFFTHGSLSSPYSRGPGVMGGMMGGMSPMAGAMGGGAMGGGFAAAPSRGGPLAVAGADYQAFEAILKQVQAAWSAGDINRLRNVATPEMLSYFAEELASNQSQGVVNRVEQVELLRGDLREAWDEGRMHYATCYLQWRALDYTERADRSDVIVGGDPRQPSVAAELWTFARSPGGHWLLSAIQQA